MSSLQLSEIPQFVASGLTIGGLYALVGIGFSISQSASGVLNFAQGQYVMLSGILAAWLTEKFGTNLYVAAVAGILLSLILGGLLGIGVKKLSHLTELQLGVATLALATAVQAASLAIFGSQQFSLEPVAGQHVFTIFGTSVTASMVLLLAASILVTILLEIFLRRTRWGRAMVATATHRTAASLLGVSPVIVTVIAFAIAGLVGGIGGVVVTPITAVNYASGFNIAISGFAAAVLGGVGSVSGALYGGLLLGLVTGVGGAYIPSGYTDALPLAILIVALIVRPQGLRGRIQRKV